MTNAAAPEKSGQQKRREKTREQLLAAAERLFAAHGADAVSIDEIVGAAEVAKGTFYNYFTDKEDVARALAGRVYFAVEEEIGRVNDGVSDAAERVARALCIYQLFGRRNPTQAQLLLRMQAGIARGDAPHNKGAKADLTAGIAQGRFDIETTDHGLVVVVGSVLAGIGRAIDERGRTSLAEAGARASELAVLVLRALGVSSAKARTIAEKAASEIFKREKERMT